MVQNAGYIGYTGASSTAVSVIADIAESIDVSGIVDVSGTSLDNILAKVTLTNAGLDTIAANVLATSAVSVAGSVTTSAPVNQNVSGISLDAIKVATEAIQVDAAAMEVLLTGIDADTDAIKTDAAAIEVLLTNANTDHAANEVLLTSIDADTNAIKIDAAAIEVLLTGIDADTDAIKTDAAAIEVLLTGIDADTNAIKTDIAANEVLLTAIDTVLDTIKVDTEAIETAVEGVLDVAIQPSTSSYLSHVYIDLDAAGDNPTSNTEVIAAGGASTKLVIYGIQGSIAGSTGSAYGNWFLSDGNTSAATTLWTGRAQGSTNTQFELTFPYGVALTANTALKVTSTEGSGNIFINAVIYYRTEAT
jgi:hypothetical protein